MTATLKRRDFITLLGGAAVWPLPAHAQRSGVPRIGFLHAASPARFSDAAFREGLREAGFIEGQNVAFEYRRECGALDTVRAQAAPAASGPLRASCPCRRPGCCRSSAWP
jgi:putative tryptophan/tyrosine transport system substrate-binding protein